MIKEEKVILMTKLASYESGKGKKDLYILYYFWGEYIGFQILKLVIAATVFFFAVFAVYVFYNFETLIQDIYKMDLLSYGKTIIILYLCVVGAYGVISYVIYANRYNKAKKNLRVYYANLRKLTGMYADKE